MSFLPALPFFILLACIAILPLAGKGWWERFYPVVSFGLAIATALFYVLVRRTTLPIIESGVEYISFVALVGSLFVIAGGINIRLRGRSRPVTNVLFLAIGAIVANLVGTTGASMIMIRPFIRVNRYRIRPFHIVFFIFIVSNVGGALTPIGDPPLFVGYLRGIPFFWPIANLWYIWLSGLSLILAVFYFVDRRDFSRLTSDHRVLAEEVGEEGEIDGLHNLFYLAVVLCAVFLTHPLFLREGLMIAAAGASYFSTNSNIHRKNDFDFTPIKEVSILFFGIFVTMTPALEWISRNAANFGMNRPGQFYWTTGALSSVLDNTPTYLNFLSAAFGVFLKSGVVNHILDLVRSHVSAAAVAGYPPDIRGTIQTLLRHDSSAMTDGTATFGDVSTAYLIFTRAAVVQAISIGAVFFGAMTYIGNGPNFMVKSIAEKAGVRCPSFVAYIIRYALPILLPTLVLIWFVYFRS